MFYILKDNQRIGATELPTYIHLQSNGCYMLCPEPDAQGIVYGNTVYQLLGRQEMKGTEDSILLQKQDAGAELAQQRADLDYLAAMSDIPLTVASTLPRKEGPTDEPVSEGDST